MRWIPLVALVACAPTTPPPGSPADAPAPIIDAPPSGTPDASDVLGAPWHLVWSDEFDGAAGAAPDPARWRHDVGGDGWGNAQLEFDTDRVENAHLDGAGHLAFVARREDFGGRAYTSARINTAGAFEHQYGRFEARLRQPRGQGLWPAFWMLGNDLANAGWPGCGEIDVMEYRGQNVRGVRGTIHGPGYSGAHGIGMEYDGGVDLSSTWHTYAVEWEPGRITWFLDDKAYFTATPNSLPAGTTWVYDHPFFVILNVAVGGYFVGSPDGTTSFPQTMLVDHVRVYERLP